MPTVSLDTCVLLRLFNVGREGLLAGLPGIEWVVVDAVEEEVTYPEQKARLEALFAAGVLQRGSLDTEGLKLFTTLCQRMQHGEAAALAWAIRHGRAIIANDERRGFHAEALARVGPQRILTTPGIFLLAIRAKLLTVAEADALKAELQAHHRFAMRFESFADLLDQN